MNNNSTKIPTDQDEDNFVWPTLEEIIKSWQHSKGLLKHVEEKFSAYTGLEGLKEAFFMGVESRDCEGMIPNPYATDDPKYKAFNAGYKVGIDLWGKG